MILVLEKQFFFFFFFLVPCSKVLIRPMGWMYTKKACGGRLLLPSIYHDSISERVSKSPYKFMYSIHATWRQQVVYALSLYSRASHFRCSCAS